MKTHVVKEIIMDCLLCVEIEPQPIRTNSCGIPFWNDGSVDHRLAPIAIGDTVYQGEEWIGKTSEPVAYNRMSQFSEEFQENLRESATKIHLPETMPIELAESIFVVVGIEVDLIPKIIDHGPSLRGHVMSHGDKKWFWNYQLEEIK